MSFKLLNKIFTLEVHQIERNSKSILLHLANFANEKGYCFPSQDTLKRQTGLGETAFREAMKWLKEMGIIAHSRRQVRGRRLSDEYFINLSYFYPQMALTDDQDGEQDGVQIDGEIPAKAPVDKKEANPRKTRVGSEVNPRNTGSEPSENEGCYISGICQLTLNDKDIGEQSRFMSAKQVADWFNNRGWHLGINTNNPSFKTAEKLGITQDDLDYVLSEMVARNKGTHWAYMCKVLESTVTKRAMSEQKLTAPTGQSTSQVNGQARAAAIAALLESNGVTDAVLVQDFVQVCSGKKGFVLTQTALDTWKQEAKANGLDWNLTAIIRWCVGKARAVFNAPWAANKPMGAPSHVEQATAEKERYARDLQEAAEIRNAPTRKTKAPFKLADTLKQAMSANAEKQEQAAACS